MAYLEELTKFEREVFRTLTGDEKLMRAVVNTNYENSLIHTLPLKNGRKSLAKDFMYENLFPYPWIGTDMEQEKKAYLTMDIIDISGTGGHFKNMGIAIYAFSHQDVVKMLDENNETVNRINYILQRVDRLLNGSRNFGIGKLMFEGMRSERMSNTHPGRFIVYGTSEFNGKPRLREDQAESDR